MDIDVNTTGIDEDLQKERYLFSVGNEAFVGTLDRLGEIRVSHVATIGKKELLRTFLFAAFGIAHEANDLNQVRFYMNRHEVFVHLAAKNIDDALTEIAGRKIEKHTVGSGEGKRQFGMRECDAFKLCNDVGELCVVAF